MVLGLTQPLTEMSTRNISLGVKAAGALGCQPYHICVPTVLKCGRRNLPEPSGPVQDCNGIAVSLPFALITPADVYKSYYHCTNHTIIIISYVCVCMTVCVFALRARVRA
jgi:hypothetical protein